MKNDRVEKSKNSLTQAKTMRLWAARALALFFGTVVALLLAEGVTRLYLAASTGGNKVAGLFESAGEGQAETYRLKPGAEVLGYKVNSKGLRNREIDYPKPTGVFRIISAGDSVAFGMGVKSPQNVAAGILEERFKDSAFKLRIEVINAGVPGYNSKQEFLFLRDELMRYGPDFVVVHFCLNDADPIELEHRTQRLWTAHARLAAGDISFRSLLNQSLFLQAVKNQLLSLDPQLRAAAINARVGETAWREMKEALAQIGSLCDRKGVGLLVVLYPWEVQLSVGVEKVLPQRDLRASLSRNGTACLDLFERFKAKREHKLFFVDGVHPTELGHQIAAEAIFNHLKASDQFVACVARVNDAQKRGGYPEQQPDARRSQFPGQ